MRVALLSAIQPTSDGTGVRGLLSLAGRSLGLRQVELALSMGCERIICLAQGPDEDSLAMQHRSERDGARFHFVPHARGLSGLVNADDELFVFAEGLFTDAKLVGELLEGSRTVLTVPAEKGVPQGYERIDRDYAWAGILKTRGSSVEQVREMGADVDPVSALLRIALQSGGAMRAIPEEVLDDGRWMLLWDRDGASAFEAGLIRRTVSVASFAAPFHALIDRTIMAFRKYVGSPALSYGLPGLASLLLGGSLYLGWTLKAGWALVALALAALFFRAARTFQLFGTEETGRPGRSGMIFDAVTDLALLVIVTASFPRSLIGSAIFAALVLLAMFRLVPWSGPPWAGAMVQDRVLASLLLAGGAFVGEFLLSIQILAGIMLIMLLSMSWKARLTRS